MIAIILGFYCTQLTSAGNAGGERGEVYPADELTEAPVSAATQSDSGNLSTTPRVGDAADSRVGL